MGTRSWTGRVVTAVGVSVAGASVPVVQARLARRRGLRLAVQDFVLDGPVGSGGEHPIEMAWIGDSTVAGVGADGPEGTLPRQVATQLGRPVHLRVYARSGARVADVLAEQLPRLEASGVRPDLVVISVGANDVAHLTPRRRFRLGYEELLDHLDGVTVVALSIPDMGVALAIAEPLRSIVGARARMLDRCIRAATVGRDHADHVDIARRPPDIARRAVRAFLSADLYHPNAAGYGIWAAFVTAHLHGRPLPTRPMAVA